MLAVPLLMGVAVSRPSVWQLVLAGVAAAGYLASASMGAWWRARRDPYRTSLLVYGGAFGLLGLVLTITHPTLLAALVVMLPAGLLMRVGIRRAGPRSLSVSLAQAAMALVLLPASAALGGGAGTATVARAALVAGISLGGTVLVVRSVIRERDNAVFAGVSIAYHAVGLLVTVVVLSPAYALLVMALGARAAALPLLQRRWAGTGHPLAPIYVGMVETIVAVTLVTVTFLVPL